MINITVQGKGGFSIKTLDGITDIEIDGEFCNSGCQDKNLVEALGYETIAQVSDIYELLKHFTDDELIDEMCNNNDRNLDEITKQLDEADQPL